MSPKISISAGFVVLSFFLGCPTVSFAEGFPGLGSRAAWSDAIPYYNHGNKYLNDQRFDDAERRFREAIERYPYDPDFYINLGVACRKQDNYVGAEQAFKKATELSPKDWTAWSNLGNAYLKQNRFRETLAIFEKTLTLNPPKSEQILIRRDIEDLHRYMRNLGMEPRPGAKPAAGAKKGAAPTKATKAATKIAPSASVQTPAAAPVKPFIHTNPGKDWGYE